MPKPPDTLKREQRASFALPSPKLCSYNRSVNKLAKNILFVASVVTFVISLTVPAYYDEKSPQGTLGIDLLWAGALGLFGGYFCWLANPLIGFVWMSVWLKKPVRVICGAIAGSMLCLSFLRYDSILVNEAGHESPITSLGTGYWLWLSTPLLMLIYGLLDLTRKPVSQGPECATSNPPPSTQPEAKEQRFPDSPFRTP